MNKALPIVFLALLLLAACNNQTSTATPSTNVVDQAIDSSIQGLEREYLLDKMRQYLKVPMGAHDEFIYIDESGSVHANRLELLSQYKLYRQDSTGSWHDELGNKPESSSLTLANTISRENSSLGVQAVCESGTGAYRSERSSLKYLSSGFDLDYSITSLNATDVPYIMLGGNAGKEIDAGVYLARKDAINKDPSGNPRPTRSGLWVPFIAIQGISGYALLGSGQLIAAPYYDLGSSYPAKLKFSFNRNIVFLEIRYQRIGQPLYDTNYTYIIADAGVSSSKDANGNTVGVMKRTVSLAQSKGQENLKSGSSMWAEWTYHEVFSYTTDGSNTIKRWESIPTSSPCSRGNVTVKTLTDRLSLTIGQRITINNK